MLSECLGNLWVREYYVISCNGANIKWLKPPQIQRQHRQCTVQEQSHISQYNVQLATVTNIN